MAQSVQASLSTLEEKKIAGAIQADVADLRTKFAALLAKLDADVGVTDTNYGATLAVATAQSAA